MPIPTISWDIATTDSSGKVLSSSPATSWAMGTLDADGTDKAYNTFLIWNNKGSATPTSGSNSQSGTDTSTTLNRSVSDMQVCTITAVDSNHGNSGAGNSLELLKDQWIKVKCTSAKDIDFFGIGSISPDSIDSGAHAIGANIVAKQTISGAGNLGDPVTDTANYAAVDIKLVIPKTASAGPVSGFLRVTYRYI